jgi:2-polyprenyl-6-methoxyphenol hydroxylase-like FAD-dependent oxidoreductase
MPLWLRRAGLPGLEEHVVDAQVGYASRWYRISDSWPAAWWWKGVWIDVDPPHSSRGGVLFPLENDRMIITVAGVGGDYPPTGEAEFLAWMGSLRSPLLADMARASKPISPIYGFRNMANQWRRYDKWPARLAGFVALGDAVCRLNPYHGQGMSTAAASAELLAQCCESTALRATRCLRCFSIARPGCYWLRGTWQLQGTSRFQPRSARGRRRSMRFGRCSRPSTSR